LRAESERDLYCESERGRREARKEEGRERVSETREAPARARKGGRDE
jgi:hypothetical protein